MARNTKKKKAQVNKQLWERANNHLRSKWRSKSQKGYDFYLDDQLTGDELSALDESGMPSFTINRILPIIEIMKYFATANNPRWKAVGVEGSDVDIAQIHSDVADYCWYHSSGSSIYSQVILDALVKGIGYLQVDVDQNADNGKGEVVFRKIDPYDVYVDPMSRDFLFRDASFIMIKKNLSRSQLKTQFPEFARKVSGATTGHGGSGMYSQRDTDYSNSVQPEDTLGLGINPNGEEDDTLEYYENYTKVKIPFVNVTIQMKPSEEEMAQIREQVQVQMQEFQQEIAVGLQEKEIELQNAMQSEEIIPERAKLEMQKAQKMSEVAVQEKQQELLSMAQDAATQTEQQVMREDEFDVRMQSKEYKKLVVDYVRFYETRVKLICSIGEDTFLYEYELPIDEYPIIPIPYLYTGTPYPMSATMPLIGKQQEINKAHQVMLHNANLASNLRWQYEEGSIPEEEWEQYSSSPGALLKYRQGFNAPTPILPAPINNAFFTVVQEGKSDAEYISGVPSAMMGFVQDQSETYRGLLANDEFGTRRLRAWMLSLVEPALEHTGKIFQKIAQKHYTIDKVFRIVQPEAGIDNVKESRINVPIYNDYGEVVGQWANYESAKFDIRFITGSTMPINRWALIDEYFKWFQAGLIDDIAMVAETDIRNKKQLLERKSLYAQLQGQLEQLTDAMKDKEGTIETLERQLVQSGIKMKIKDADSEVRKSVLETEAQQKLLRNVMKNEIETAKKELSMDIKNSLTTSKE
jgi:hypothetical protein